MSGTSASAATGPSARQSSARGRQAAPWPLLGGAIILAVLAGGVAGGVAPELGVVALLGIGFVGLAALRPATAAAVIVTATPLLVGINRSGVIPLLRPHEGLVLLAAVGLGLRGLVHLLRERVIPLRPSPVDVAIGLLLVAGSVLPLLWLIARGRPLAADDLLYTLVLWKYAGLYLVFRVAVRTPGDVRRCLWLSLGAVTAVAAIGILQALRLFGIPGLLAAWYAPFDVVSAVDIGRGTSTIAQSHAVADVMVGHLAIVAGFLVRGEPRRRLLVSAAGLLTLGLLASGTASGVIALLIAAIAIGVATRNLGRVTASVGAAAALGGVLLAPVLQARLADLDPDTGLPMSWLGRIENLRTYFLPELGHGGWLLGVRPAARLPASRSLSGFVFIESGHVWLLWIGGIPFFLAFVAYVWISGRATLRVARTREDAVGVAGVAAFTMVVVTAVLMTLDPHLTLRGSADLTFMLLALAGVRAAAGSARDPALADGPADAGAPRSAARRVSVRPPDLDAWTLLPAAAGVPSGSGGAGAPPPDDQARPQTSALSPPI